MPITGIFDNPSLLTALAAWLAAQILKPPVEYLRKGKWKWGYLFSAGGMPSSHSSLMVGATMGIGLHEGFNTAVFALAIAMTMIVILVSLWPINAIADRLHGSALPETQLRLSMKRVDALGHVSEILIANKLEIGQIATQRLSKDLYQADVAIRGRHTGAIATAIEQIASLPGVDIVSTTQGD